MTRTIGEIVAEARSEVPEIAHDEARRLLGAGGAVFVDVREPGEVAQSGKVAGALAIPRGVLEFQACASMPSHDPTLSSDRTVVLYCGSGGRAALAGRALRALGFSDVRNLGGFKDWVEAGGPVERG